MKIFSVFVLSIIAIFLSCSFFIIPEYKTRVIVALILDLLLLFVFIYFFFSSYFYRLIFLLKTKRTRYLIKNIFVMFVLFIGFFYIIESNSVKRLDITWGKDKYALSYKSVSLLKSIKSNVEMFLIKSKNDNEQKFFAYAQELERNLSYFSFDIINPNIDVIKFKNIEKRIGSSAVSGDVVVLSGKNFIITNDISEIGLVNAVIASVTGKKEICVLNKFLEDKFDAYSDKGFLLLNKNLNKLGFVLKLVSADLVKHCQSLVVADIEKDLTNEEILSIKNFTGKLFLAGGLSFIGMKNLLKDFGFSVSDASIIDEGSRTFVGSGSSPMTTVLSSYKNVVLDSPYALQCDDCVPLAFTSSTSKVGKDNGPYMVLAKKGPLIVLSSFPGTNYFMRFKSNISMFQNIFYELAGVSGISYKMSDQENSYLILPPIYITLLFVFFLIILPLFTGAVGVYLILKDNIK